MWHFCRLRWVVKDFSPTAGALSKMLCRMCNTLSKKFADYLKIFPLSGEKACRWRHRIAGFLIFEHDGSGISWTCPRSVDYLLAYSTNDWRRPSTRVPAASFFFLSSKSMQVLSPTSTANAKPTTQQKICIVLISQPILVDYDITLTTFVLPHQVFANEEYVLYNSLWLVWSAYMQYVVEGGKQRSQNKKH